MAYDTGNPLQNIHGTKLIFSKEVQLQWNREIKNSDLKNTKHLRSDPSVLGSRWLRKRPRCRSVL